MLSNIRPHHDPLDVRQSRCSVTVMTSGAERLLNAAKKLADPTTGYGEDWDALVKASGVPPEVAEGLVGARLIAGSQVDGELFGRIIPSYVDSTGRRPWRLQ